MQQSNLGKNRSTEVNSDCTWVVKSSFIIHPKMQLRSIFALLPATAPLFATAAPSAQRVEQLFHVLTTGNFTDFFALFRPDSTWTTIGYGVRDYDEMVDVFSEINCLLSNPPFIIETDLVLSQGQAGPYTSVKAHVPNGYIGTNGIFFCLIVCLIIS